MRSSVLVIIVLFIVLLLLALGGVAAIIVTSVVRKRRNDNAPQKTENAAVAAKRTSVQSHPIAGDASGAHGYTRFDIHHVAFLTEDGTQTEFVVDEQVYERLTEGDRGRLTYQGTRFISFEPAAD